MGDVESHAVLLPSFVTHAVTHNKKGPNGKPLSPCFKWSG